MHTVLLYELYSLSAWVCHYYLESEAARILSKMLESLPGFRPYACK